VNYLKAELLWHSEFKRALLQLLQMYPLFHKTEDTHIQVTVRLKEAEQRYLGQCGITPNANTEEGVIRMKPRKAGFGRIDWNGDRHDIMVWTWAILLYCGC
jgi:hypothetical protein